MEANQCKEELKSKIIYILRHGQTDFNKEGKVQGRGVDASLNEVGRSQARKAGAVLNNVPFDSIYSSYLKRTQETLREFIQEQRDIIALDGFDEISWGNQEGKAASMDAKNLYADTVTGWRNGNLSLAVGGGESPLQVMQRQKAAMDVVLSSNSERSLICMHGRAIRILLCWMLNYPLNFMDGFPHDNCAFYALEYRTGSFVVREFNQTGHLQ